MKLVVCCYGGPGTGKSTTGAGLYTKFKQADYNAEMNREYIKEWVWEGRKVKPGDQTYFFAKQARKERLYMENGIEVIITDSPLILTHFYGLKYDQFEKEFNTSLQMLKQHHAICKYYGYKVEHIFLNRTKEYNPKGRFQDEKTAKEYDEGIRGMLEQLGIKYEEFNADNNASEDIFNYLEDKY
ncbi:ATP-binding protein [bacterium]|nr:ATP-binding protein [bacterium]